MDRDDGFTLIELLVVVVIISILASIAIPSFLAQRQSAYVASATNDLRQVRIALDSLVVRTGSYALLDGASQTSAALVDQGYEGKATTSLVITSTSGAYCVQGFDVRAPEVLLVARSTSAGVERDAGGC